MQQNSSSSTAYDDAYRTMLEKCSSLVLPVMKLNCYGMDELFEKKLWFLLPFHGFCYEETFPESETDQDRREELTGIFREIRRRLDELCSSGQMNECQKYRIIFCVNMVLQKLMEKYPNTRKEVLDVMGGKVVECEVDWILQRGIEQGLKQGLKQGLEQGLEQGRSQLIENLLNNKKTLIHLLYLCIVVLNMRVSVPLNY